MCRNDVNDVLPMAVGLSFALFSVGELFVNDSYYCDTVRQHEKSRVQCFEFEDMTVTS